MCNTSKSMGITRGTPKKLGRDGASPLGTDRVPRFLASRAYELTGIDRVPMTFY